MRQTVAPEVLQSSLFRGMAAAVVEEFLAAATLRSLAAGEALFLQGDPVEALFLVESGRLKLSQVTPDGEEVIVRTVGPGDVVVGVAVLDKRTLPVSGVAIAACRVLAWPRPRILELAARHPLLRMNVVGTIADRMHDSLSRIRELSTESVGQRVARALLRLARDAGREVENGTLIDQPLGRQELAELAGTSMFTASRLLARWGREGVLEVGRQRVVVRSLDRLRRLASDDEQAS
ncbi:MAG: Crp/Fnr family transcriptional regulator [Thermoanaerobaculia bacterium]|nr:MAG: Crp/Fnr family transcriptional regulator [Thermoanaerobaculia bacterium]